MAGLQDMMARAAAAQGGMADPGMGGGMPPEGEEQMGAPMDIESALSGVEQALVGMNESVVSDIRVHLNAIRELVAQDGGGVEAPPEEGAAPPPTEVPVA